MDIQTFNRLSHLVGTHVSRFVRVLGATAARDAERQKRLETKLKRQAKQLGYELVPLEHKPAA
jgi:hypothetical protein